MELRYDGRGAGPLPSLQQGITASGLWFLNGKILRRHTFGLFQIWTLDMITPLFRRIDWLLPSLAST
jgi:hypothetical protein